MRNPGSRVPSKVTADLKCSEFLIYVPLRTNNVDGLMKLGANGDCGCAGTLLQMVEGTTFGFAYLSDHQVHAAQYSGWSQQCYMTDNCTTPKFQHYHSITKFKIFQSQTAYVSLGSTLSNLEPVYLL